MWYGWYLITVCCVSTHCSPWNRRHTHTLSASGAVCLWSGALCCSWGKIITQHHTDLQHGRVQLLWGESTHSHRGGTADIQGCLWSPDGHPGWWSRVLDDPCVFWSTSRICEQWRQGSGVWGRVRSSDAACLRGKNCELDFYSDVMIVMWDIIDSIIYLCKRLVTVLIKKIKSDQIKQLC